MSARIVINGFGEADAAIGAGLAASDAGIEVFDVRIARLAAPGPPTAAGAPAPEPVTAWFLHGEDAAHA